MIALLGYMLLFLFFQWDLLSALVKSLQSISCLIFIWPCLVFLELENSNLYIMFDWFADYFGIYTIDRSAISAVEDSYYPGTYICLFLCMYSIYDRIGFSAHLAFCKHGVEFLAIFNLNGCTEVKKVLGLVSSDSPKPQSFEDEDVSSASPIKAAVDVMSTATKTAVEYMSPSPSKNCDTAISTSGN